MDAFLYTSALSSPPIVDRFAVPFQPQYAQKVRWTITRSSPCQGDVPGVTTGQPQCYSCPSLSQFLFPLSVCTSALTCGTKCGLHGSLCTSSATLRQQKKTLQKNRLNGALLRFCECGPVCLWALLDTESMAVSISTRTEALYISSQHLFWSLAKMPWFLSGVFWRLNKHRLLPTKHHLRLHFGLWALGSQWNIFLAIVR